MEKISELITNYTQQYPWREIKEPKAPCLIAMRFGSPEGVVNHTAVYIGKKQYNHARERIGVCIDRIDNPAWERVIVGYYEYVGE